MMALVIDAIREKYSASEVKTMTVGELIEELQQWDENAPVVLSHDGGYTYGGIRRNMFEEVELEEE